MKNDWKVIALIYSGKADPQWQLTKEQADHFIDLWNQAPGSGSEVVIPSLLGFKGIRLLSEKKQYLIYKGVITCLEQGMKSSKTDEGKNIEKFLLSTAPEQTLKILNQLNVL
jgi:hypothetical protein